MNLREKYDIPADSVITIAGTVGVGKTTMTKRLAEALHFKTSFEKVDKNPYLEDFYADFERWSFHLQIYFLAERFKEQKGIFASGGGVIQDRSIYEDSDIFAKMQYENGTMTTRDYQTYCQLFAAMVMTPYLAHPDLLIYLEGSFADIMARIEERGRQMEKDTSLSYWKDMYERYDQWINDFNQCPVLRINITDYDLIHEESHIELIIREVSHMLKATKNSSSQQHRQGKLSL